MKNNSNILSMLSPDSGRPCLDLDEIITYAGDEFNSKKKAEIESHLQNCELCSDAVEGFRNSAGAPQFRESVDELHQTMHRKLAQTSNKKRMRRIYYAIAAIFLLALVSAFYLLQEKPLPERAYAQYFKIYPNTLPLIRSESGSNLFRQAMMEYELENFSNSLIILNKLIAWEPENDAAHFYAGMCQLISGEPQPAAKHFETILQNTRSKLFDAAHWYFGLSLLKRGNLNEAEAVFQSVPEVSKFKKQSEEILNYLSNNR